MKANDKEYLRGVCIGLIGGIVGSILFYTIYAFESEPKGIGGFVQREIDWAEQTYNVLKENCEYTTSVGGIYYLPDRKELCCNKWIYRGEYSKEILNCFPIKNIE